MRKHDHGQIPQSNLNKMKLKTRGLFKNGCSIKASHLNGSQENKGGVSSSLLSGNLDTDTSNLNGDEDGLRCSTKELARSVEDDDEQDDFDDDEDEEDYEDDDMDDEEDEEYDEDENEEVAKSVENNKVLVSTA